MNNRSKNKGFSLVELIVVIAVMAVLVGVLAPAYLRYVDKTKLQKDVSAIGELVEAIKVAAAEEDVAKEIPNPDNASWDTFVQIKAVDGVISAYLEGITSGKNANDLQEALHDTVGTSMEFSNKTLKEKGLTLQITRDEYYNIVVSVEVYDFQDDEEVLKALSVFNVFKSNNKVINSGVSKATQKYTEELAAKRKEYEGKFGGETKAQLAALSAASDELTQLYRNDPEFKEAVDKEYKGDVKKLWNALKEQMGW